MSATHKAFSDETNWNDGDVRGLCVISIRSTDEQALCGEIAALLAESGVKEFAWKKFSQARERFAAERLLNFLIEKARFRVMRADCLTWTIKDSRHEIKNRDDVANLERMYHHLFKNVLARRWPDEACWELNPDEHTAIDWKGVAYHLDRKDFDVEYDNNLLTSGKPDWRIRRVFNLACINPLTSDHPLIQLADLVAGLAAYSRKAFEGFREWDAANAVQKGLFESPPPRKLSKAENERFPVLRSFNVECKKRKLGVGLMSSQGLKTHDPKNPINFWWYDPQHPDDKAPTKAK